MFFAFGAAHEVATTVFADSLFKERAGLGCVLKLDHVVSLLFGHSRHFVKVILVTCFVVVPRCLVIVTEATATV